MFLSRVRIFAALIAAASMTPAAYAADGAPAAQSEDAKAAKAIAFAESLIDEASVTLSDASLSEDERHSKFQGFLAEKMDLEFISKIVLAKRYRSEMSDAQSARYDAAFPGYMTRIYANQFNKIFGKPYTVVGSHPASRGDILVDTDFETGEHKTLNVVWRIRDIEGENKIVDIIVQGGSIITLKREEFSSFVENNGVDLLLEEIEK